jgi:hypothetical protein
MRRQPLTMMADDGTGELLLSMPAVLLMAAAAANDFSKPPAAVRNSQKILNAFLDAAQAGGYTQRDIFLTIAAQLGQSNEYMATALGKSKRLGQSRSYCLM